MALVVSAEKTIPNSAKDICALYRYIQSSPNAVSMSDTSFSPM